LESSDVFPVDSTLGAVDDLPVLERLVDREPSRGTMESRTPLSRESNFGRFLNWVRCTTVGFESRRAIESFLAVLGVVGEVEGIGLKLLGVWLLGEDSTTDELEARNSTRQIRIRVTKLDLGLTAVGHGTQRKHELGAMLSNLRRLCLSIRQWGRCSESISDLILCTRFLKWRPIFVYCEAVRIAGLAACDLHFSKTK
jgi:hypothetical protein